MLGDTGVLADSCRQRQWPELCTFLEQGHSADLCDSSGTTPLQICAALGWSEAVALLLKHGADVHRSCPLGWTALMQAARNGHTAIVRMLINAGANVAGTNSLGWDVLSLAVVSRNEDLMTMLIPMAKTDALNSALAVACQQGILDAVKCFLNQRVDVNRTLPNSGVTPLMLAACEGHKPIVEILLSHGADPHFTNLSKLSALDMAIMNAHRDIVAVLSPFRKSRARPTLVLPSLPMRIPTYSCNSSGYPERSPYPCTTAYHNLNVDSHNPKIFKFPPSPTCVRSAPNHMSCQYSPFSYFSPNVSPTFCSPHDASHMSPTLCPSPLIPPWMFAYGYWQQKLESEPVFKRRKRHWNWWKKLKKRCKGKKPKKRIKVYVTFDEDDKDPAERQMEALLHALDLESLGPILKSHEIDMGTLLKLREEDLEELGIVDKSIQFSVLQKISNFNRNIFN